jgi:diaminopimelate decarboxylase
MVPLPAAVRDAIERARGPTLVFDLAAIEATMTRVAATAHAHGVRVVLAAKAFPLPEVLGRAASRLDGVDLAGAGERAMARAVAIEAGAALVSITDPALDAAAIAALPDGPITVTCETVEQVRAVRAARPAAAIAARLSISATMPGDDAVGALQAGDGHRRSRFGAEDDAALRALVDAARGARTGVHVHSAGVVPTSPARWAAIAAAVVAAAGRAGLEPAFVDLGGGWHGVAGELVAALAAVRAAVPRGIELVIEPGRLFSRDAGYAVGDVVAARRLADRELRVVSLSRIAHLRWSPIELIARAPRPGHATKLTVAGPTCFEDDVLGDWSVDAAAVPEVGARLVWSGVTGYSAAWNRGFAGVPEATITVV